MERKIVAAKFANIDEYIRLFPDEVQEILEQIRRTIRNAVPTADEVISYQMPTIRLDGQRLVHFAAWKHHVAIYPPIPTAEEPLEQELAPYRDAKGTVKFSLSEPIPYDVIERLVTFLVRRRLDGVD